MQFHMLGISSITTVIKSVHLVCCNWRYVIFSVKSDCCNCKLKEKYGDPLPCPCGGRVGSIVVFHFLARTGTTLRIILIFFSNLKKVTAQYPKLEQCYFLPHLSNIFFHFNLPIRRHINCISEIIKQLPLIKSVTYR